MRVLELNSVSFFILPLLLNSCSLCFYFVPCRRLSMISQNLQYVVEFLQNRWFVEHLSEFCRNSFCYFQLPCFHFHIPLFKQILKPELRGMPDNCRMSSYFADISRKIRNVAKIEWKKVRLSSPRKKPLKRWGCWLLEK